MKYKMNRKRDSDRTITSVLLGSYTKAMVISFLCAIIFFLIITGKEMVYRQNMNNSRILNTFTYFVNMQLGDMKRFSYNLIIDEELQDILEKKGEGASNQISTYLMHKMAERNEIQSIHILRGNETVSEYKRPVYDEDPSKFVKKLGLNASDRDNYSFTWEIGKDSLNEQEENTFYLVGSIRSKKSLEHLGYLIVFLDMKEVQKSLSFYLKEVNYEVLVKSSSGNCIALPLGADIEKFSNQLVYRAKADNSWWQILNTHPYASQKISSIQGEIYGMMNTSPLQPNVEFSLIFILIMTIEFIIIASVIMKKHVIGPLEQIAKSARDIGVQGNLNILFPKEKYYSEADDISKALNEMMEEIRNLVQDVEQREKLQKRLELSVINHQVKPHFLYNTLNAVSILISVEEKESANQLISSMAKYYRACLSQGRDIISLENEMEITKEYIKIALIRNPNILKVTYEIDEGLMDVMIPKMTIQTLVENSIKYGIKQMGEPIHIRICATRKGDTAQLCVEDNGSGMKADTIDKIMRGELLETESGFGVRSVVMRISLSYDIKEIKDIISIESKESAYTRIFLNIPIQGKEEEGVQVYND